jgi:hypothetical protein
MTIVACVKVYDGLVLGADSATQIMGQDDKGNVTLLKSYQNAKKLFQFQALPIGILTYGIGNIGKKSIETLLRDFDRENPIPKTSDYKVLDVANKLFAFFKNAYDKCYASVTEQIKKPILGFYIAGYSHSSTEGEEWEFILPQHTQPVKVRELDVFGSSWRGVSIPFSRLYFGLDPRARKDLADMGIKEEVLSSIQNKYTASVIYDGMPVKAAIEFVKFILKTTIGLSSFEIGSASCSEPISIAIISQKGEFNFLENI